MHKIRGKIVLQQELYNVSLAHCLCKNSCKKVTKDIQNTDFINIRFFLTFVDKIKSKSWLMLLNVT